MLGHLLTGSNFDDTVERVTGGRHGYGAKLTNIFSTEFAVDTVDTAAGLRYQQHWKNNMKDCSEPVVTKLKGSDRAKDVTRITFSPDLPREHRVLGPAGFVCFRTLDLPSCTMRCGGLPQGLAARPSRQGRRRSWCGDWWMPPALPTRSKCS